jgi:tRNA A-37 threonylcarbamoyl transferase component Bud32
MNPDETDDLRREREIDAACLRFEAAWQAGERPRIEDYLKDAAESTRSALLAELLRLEVEYRRAKDEQFSAAEYVARFAGQETIVAHVLAIMPHSAPPQVPGYEVLAELGHGSMGVVYKARHLKFKRLVALKMILARGHADAQLRARFLAEARAVASLQHPNIVQIHEIGDHDGLPFFSLEYVDGDTLAARLKAAPPSDMEAAQLVELLARTVHYAHGRGIIHRDLKPANILLTSDRLPKIADFGLAKILSEDSGATQSGAILGTPSYMAPEQAAGEVKHIGPACDIYALGATLYELLTGRPPFRADGVLETLKQVAEQLPAQPRVHNPRVDRALEAICLKCLAKEPGNRYATADALANDLAAYQRGEPVAAEHGTASLWIGALLHESRFTEVLTLNSQATMAGAVGFFLCMVALVLLVNNGVKQYAPYYAVLVVRMVTDFACIWIFRCRSGPPLWYVERQLLHIGAAVWLLIFFTTWQHQRAGGSVADLFPIILFEAAFFYACAAIVLGGSFYPTAIVLGGIALLGVVWPDIGMAIAAIGCAPGLFWVGWKHWRRRLVR